VRDEVINAIGPETFTYREMVAKIAALLSLRRWIVGAPPSLAFLGCAITGAIVGDVIITRDEIRGLMQNKLFVDAPPLGATRLTEWIARHKDTLGRQYTSEMARRNDRLHGYRSN